MADMDEAAKRHIPTLKEWLGDGTRADGFEDWVSQTLAGEQHEDPGIRASMRVMRPLLIAMVEAGRREDEQGEDPVDTILRMGRGLGYCFMVAMVSKGRDDMPMLRAKKMAIEMFREGAGLFITHERDGTIEMARN